MILHPSEYRLNQFADGELSRRLRIRTAAHLEGCSRCRNTIVAIRRLGREARVLPSPSAPPGLKDRILERLANGERVILPVADPPMPAPGGRRIAAAFAATAAAAILLMVVSAPNLASEASELSWLPAPVERGSEIAFEYRATSMFAGEDTLVLRGLTRTAADGNTWHQNLAVRTIGTLVQDGSGVHRLSVKLPDDVVYGVFAVEDRDGNRVDSRGRAYWELMVYEDGNPVYDALLQKVHDLTLRDWEGALNTAREMTEVYGDRPGSWLALSSLEQEFYGFGFDRLALPRHRSELARLEERVASGSIEPSPTDIGGMYWYAWTLGDSVSAKRWRDRLLLEAPDHDITKPVRVSELMELLNSDGRKGRDRTLAALEALWREGGFEKTSLAGEAFDIASAGADADAFVRWLNRLEHTQPARVDEIARHIATVAGGTQVGMQRLRSLYDQLGSPRQVPRSLYRTYAEHQLHTQDRRQALAGILGGVLVENGEISEGLTYLNRALEGSWDVAMFSRAAGVLSGLDDTNAAFRQWARVAADPWTEQSVAGSLEALAHDAIGSDEWSGMLEAARADMAAHYLGRVSLPRRIDLDVQVAGPDGSLHSLGGLMDGRVSVFAFWSRNDHHAVQRQDSLAEISRRIDAYDGTLITVVQEERTADWEAYLAGEDFPYPIYHDAAGAASRNFDVWYNTYFVIDGAGVVQFAYSEITDVLRQVAALNHRAQQATTSLVAEEAARPH